MNTINSSDKSKRLIQSHKKVLIDDQFEEISVDSGVHHYLEGLFYTTFSIEYIQDQERNFPDAAILFYEFPVNKKGIGIIPESLKIAISGQVNDIIDDGNGNLIEEGFPDTIIGNIFYNHGVIVITNTTDQFSDGGFFIDMTNFSLECRRRIEINEEKYFLHVEPSDYSGTSNFTYDSSISSPLFLTKIYLYNEDNEVVAIASLRNPVPLTTDIFLVLDFLEPL